MAPEYAFDGLFSIKSDVFSFGILMLEIISGKRSRGFYHEHNDLTLIGHVSVYQARPQAQAGQARAQGPPNSEAHNFFFNYLKIKGFKKKKIASSLLFWRVGPGVYTQVTFLRVTLFVTLCAFFNLLGMDFDEGRQRK